MKQFNFIILFYILAFLLFLFIIGCKPYVADSDSDGLLDYFENEGWEVNYEDAYKKIHSYFVKSSDRLEDTDGDGLNDLQEFQLKSDPTSKDTDRDGILDPDEGLYGANLLDQDSDDDATWQEYVTPEPKLMDYGEIKIYKTSPALTDTDGDGMSDYYEISGGGFNPLIAETPKIQVYITDNPYIRLQTTDSEGNITTSNERINWRKEIIMMKPTRIRAQIPKQQK